MRKKGETAVGASRDQDHREKGLRRGPAPRRPSGPAGPGRRSSEVAGVDRGDWSPLEICTARVLISNAKRSYRQQKAIAATFLLDAVQPAVLTHGLGAPVPIASPGCGSQHESHPALLQATASFASLPSASPLATPGPPGPNRGAGVRVHRALQGRSRRGGARLPGASARAPGRRRWLVVCPPPRARAGGGAPRSPTGRAP